ncbi:hypothetical protein [Aequorivita echinoideorum]|uniref:Lipocalin-like domain-containing protein n=1 Tax=Aequorivita echinoideorum TaxID=1549647 RepID=A0ABS5S1N3_9FLAO|nr:hypothetical protein [Aequorivita echinoideorum]MBT0607111.1 hypothetical protein [Aequorivita echinoideorum]
MKTFILILAISLLVTGCQKDGSPSNGVPVTYDLNFELLKMDGSVYEDGEVEISNNPFGMSAIGNNQFIWEDMGKLALESQTGNGVLFGIKCGGTASCDSDYLPLEFASGAEGRDIDENETWVKDKYWLLRYPNEDIDTLKIHDVRTKSPDSRTFTFYINEQQFNVIEGLSQYYITIQK